MRHLLGPLKARGRRLNQTEYLTCGFNLKRPLMGLFSVLAALNVLMSSHAALCQSLSFEETLEKMMDIAGVRPGMTIGEIGSGGGPLTFRLAERVGKNGKIYANDINRIALETIRQKGFQNIETVLGESDDPAFPVKNLDMVIMKNVFHDLENPLSLLESLKKYLKPGAPFVVVEPHRSKEDKNTALSFHNLAQEQLWSVVKRSSFRLVRPEGFLAPRWNIYVLKVDVETEKTVWTNWLAEFLSMIEKGNELEKDNNISMVKKRIAWERILDSYRDNDPESEEDERMRTYIGKKIAWLREQEDKLVPTQKETSNGERPEDYSGVCLRVEYKRVDGDDYLETLKRLGFKAEYWVSSGDFPNQFDPQSINEDDVVVDKASNLMWHRSGSDMPLDYFAAQEWIDDLNIQRYAGYSDWRLPTTEELLSLLETDKMSGDVGIDPLFSCVQSVIWTGDDSYPGRLWVVCFNKSMGGLWDILKINPSWVRPVRSLR